MLLNLFISATVTFLYIIALANIGRAIFNVIGLNKYLESKSVFLNFTLAALFGMCILSIVWMIFGLNSILVKNYVAITIIFFLAFGLFQISFYKSLFTEISSFRKHLAEFKLFDKIFISLIVFSIFLFGIFSLVLLPTGDSEAFYMVWPKIISYTGTLIAQPNYFTFSQIGISGELHFAALIHLGGAHSATFLVWFVALFIAIILAEICLKAKLSQTASAICLLMLVTSSAFSSTISHGNVNLFSAAYSLAGVYLLLISFKNKDSRVLPALVGLFIGFSIVAKFSYVIVLFPIILILLIFHYYNLNKEMTIRINEVITYGSFITLFTLLAISTHFVKNYFMFGEPFAPFFFINSGNESFLSQVWFSEEITRRILMTYPIALIFGIYPMQGGNVTPLLLIFFPLFFLIIKRIRTYDLIKNIPFQLAVASVGGVILWMATNPSILAPRYILISFILLFPLFSKLYDRIPIENIKSILKVVILLAVALSFLSAPIPVSVKMVYNEISDNRIQNHRFYSAATYINENVPENSKVYLAGYYSYYLRPDILINLQSPDDQRKIYEHIDNDFTFTDALKKHDVNYLFVQKESQQSLLETINVDKNQTILFEDEYSIVFIL